MDLGWLESQLVCIFVGMAIQSICAQLDIIVQVVLVHQWLVLQVVMLLLDHQAALFVLLVHIVPI